MIVGLLIWLDMSVTDTENALSLVKVYRALEYRFNLERQEPDDHGTYLISGQCGGYA